MHTTFCFAFFFLLSLNTELYKNLVYEIITVIIEM